jgi:U3 small nucleolar ribonucleoprotein protein IMP4
MLRRQARERRQYVYAKSLEAQERQTYERKQRIKDALASGKQLPTELRKDAKNLGRDLAFDDAQAGMSFLCSFEALCMPIACPK